MRDSLQKRTISKIKNENPHLYKIHNNIFLKFKVFLQKLTKFKFLHIFSYFLLSSILTICYSFLKIDTVLNVINVDFENLLKALTTSTITLVSMNLFVTNLLLTHLKEERDDLEIIINEKIPFRFITYCGFTIIIFLLLLNLFHNNLSYNSKNNIILSLTYHFILFIFLLIYLYDIVFKFIVKSTRKSIIEYELNKEWYKNLYSNRFKAIFKAEYKQLFEDCNFELIDSHLYKNSETIKQNNTNIIFSSKKKKYFKDIDVKIVKNLKNLNTENCFYVLYDIDKEMTENRYFPLISTHKENQKKWFLNKIKKAYKFGSKPYLLESNYTILTIALSRLEKSTKNKSSSDVEDTLSMIRKIFKDIN